MGDGVRGPARVSFWAGRVPCVKERAFRFVICSPGVIEAPNNRYVAFCPGGRAVGAEGLALKAAQGTFVTGRTWVRQALYFRLLL